MKDYFPIQVFPNPAQNHFEIQWPEQSKKGTVQILDAQGKTVFKNNINEGQRQLTMNVDWPSGLYIVQFNFDQQSYYRRLIIE